MRFATLFTALASVGLANAGMERRSRQNLVERQEPIADVSLLFPSC